MKRAKLFTTAILLVSALISVAASTLDDLFEQPPESAKPLTWWHWVDGNVSKRGITGDLEAMKRAGLGGCYLFTIGGYFPQGPLKFGTPEWYDTLAFTVQEAERLGLVFGVHNCDGWSESGGPWITPETSMKELTWSGIEVEGGKEFNGVLAQPSAKENFYRDIAIVAFPLPEGNRIDHVSAGTKVSGTLTPAKLKGLCDGQVSPRVSFPAATNGHRIEIVLKEPQILRTMIFRNVGGYTADEDFPVTIETSTDGNHWSNTGRCTFSWDTANGAKPITVALGEVNCRSIRLSFTNPWPVQIGEIELTDAAKLQFAEAKAGWLRCRGHGGESRNFMLYPGPDRHMSLRERNVIAANSVVDLTASMTGDGRLKWTAPAGHWRVLRVGYTSNGHVNRPATPAGRGLECDKLDVAVVRAHLDHYVGGLAKKFGPATGRTFKIVETDSWECDVQNWTAGLEGRFRKSVGIDIVRWLPLMMEGWVVDSVDASERAMWDWRRFLADQLAENYFGTVRAYLKERKLTYVTEGSGRQMYMYDPLGYQRASDVPMGEFWLNKGAGQGVRVDNKVAASLAHIRGSSLVASESYTASAPYAKWQNHPYTLKPLGDRAYCAGVNQFVFHTFAHQPFDVIGPGFTMAVYGLNCNRANTWWEPGRAWMSYLSRCNYLLREGRFAGDVLWFIGEDVPNRIGWREELNPPLPRSYDFDGCDVEALMGAKVRDGRIVLTGGTEYRVLLLANRNTMRPATLRKVKELVEAGATVVGPRPAQSPSLRDVATGDNEVRQLADELWGQGKGSGVIDQPVGKGRVMWGLSFPEIFKRLNLAGDFEYETDSGDSEVLYIHRVAGGANVYFVSNQKPKSQAIRARFRVSGYQPEVWDPSTGKRTRPATYKSTATATELGLNLDPNGSVFVVFREPAREPHLIKTGSDRLALEYASDGVLIASCSTAGSFPVTLSNGKNQEVSIPGLPPERSIEEPWTVTFPPNLGAPPSAVFNKLVSWTERPEEGIKYFSGTAVYSNSFIFEEPELPADTQFILDLGSVQVCAEVQLNGKDLGILWKSPFRVDATRALKPGKNGLVVRVTNLWPNRMIGDEQKPDTMEWSKRDLAAHWPDWLLEGKPRPDGRVTFCTRKVYTKSDPLLESGLLGPVRLVPIRQVRL